MAQRIVLKHLPKYYGHNAQYEHHLGETEHAVNSSWSLKRKVQELTDKGLLHL